MSNIKIVSWNVNGLLSSVENAVFLPFQTDRPDILCLQEIRTKSEPEILTGYTHLWNHAQKDGYSGTAILLKDEPLQIMRGFGPGDPDEEGRLLTVELPSFLSTHMSQTRKKIYGGMTFG